MRRHTRVSSKERLYYDFNNYIQSIELELVGAPYHCERRRYPSALPDEKATGRTYEAFVQRVQHEKQVFTKYLRCFAGVCAQDQRTDFDDNVGETEALEAIVKLVCVLEAARGAVGTVTQPKQLCEEECTHTEEVVQLHLISSLGSSARRYFTTEKIQDAHYMKPRVVAALVAIIALAIVTAGCREGRTYSRSRETRGRGRALQETGWCHLILVCVCVCVCVFVCVLSSIFAHL